MKCDEIFAALAMLEKERGISQTFMMDKIVQALTTAYKRDHEGVENVVVDVDEGKRELKMFVQKEVVDEVENPGTQMSLDDAKAISAKYNVGDIVNIPVDNIEFGSMKFSPVSSRASIPARAMRLFASAPARKRQTPFFSPASRSRVRRSSRASASRSTLLTCAASREARRS